MKKLIIAWKILFIIIFCSLFFIQLFYFNKKARGSYYSLGYASSLSYVLSWIKENSNPEDVVLTTWDFGHQVNTYADRKVIATSKVYPSQIKTIAQRYRDIATFFFAEDEKDAAKIARKYNAKYIIFDARSGGKMCRYIDACDFVECYKPGNLSDEGRRITIVGRMLDGSEFEHFRFIDIITRNFVVYEFIK